MWLLPFDPLLRTASIYPDYLPELTVPDLSLCGVRGKKMQLTAKDAILVQTVQAEECRLRMMVTDFSKPYLFLASQPSAESSMVCCLSGGVHYTLGGLGVSSLAEGLMRFVHCRERLLDKLVFPEGRCVLLSISVDTNQLRNRGRYLMPFEYCYHQIMGGEGGSFQQASVAIGGASALLLKRLRGKDYGAGFDPGVLHDTGPQLFDLYCSDLRAMRQQQHMHDGQVNELSRVMPWLLDGLSRNIIGIPELVAKMNWTDFTVRRMFRNLLDVSPSHFVRERRLGLLRERLLLSDESVSHIAQEMGMSYDWVMNNFDTRYGQKTKEFRHWKGLFFPGQEVGDVRV
jgi:AraC-like DNA-binding protein